MLTWSLLPSASFEPLEGRVSLRSPRMNLELPDPDGGLTAALELLTTGSVPWDDLLTGEEVAELAMLESRLTRMRSLGWLVGCLKTPEGPLATLIPTAPLLTPRPPSNRGRLSRFAHLRRLDSALVLESPLAAYRVVLHDWRGPALVGGLASGALPPIPEAEAFLDLLEEGGMFWPDPPSWEFHDLVFHASTRLGRHDRDYGGTYPGRAEGPSPAVDPGPRWPTVPLDRADSESLPLWEVVSKRRSLRQQGQSPITEAQLGEFLFRTWKSGPEGWDGQQKLGRRPHPNAGALYELELYLTVDRCQGLESATYHYDSHRHLLERLKVAPRHRQALLDFVQRGTGSSQSTQILFHITSRFQRLTFKYASIAYSSTLKDVGIVLQAMYLAATALGLAPCALGGGDADLFSAATGLDYYQEPLVGEFMLGSELSSER